MSKNASEGEYAELALAVYVEELIANKRVLYVGEPHGPAPERLARTARSVDLVSSRSRVRGTRRGGRVHVRRWPDEDDDGRWDVVIVPDLPAAGLGDRERLSAAAKWLVRGGLFVAGTPDPQGPAANATALAYEDFFDLLDAAFPHVRMLGQAPFAGFSVVDFAPPNGAFDVTFDGSILARGESARRYFALCGQRDVVGDAYAIVQVPAEVVRSDDGPRISDLTERVREQQDALDAANLHAEEIEHELETARAELGRALAAIEGAEARERDLEAERETLKRRARELEQRLHAAENERFDEEYGRLEAALQERGREIADLTSEVERRGTLVRDLVEELRDARTHEPIERKSVLPSAPPELVASADVDALAQLDDAVRRAVAAEAEKAALAFELDEVRGQLALLEQGSGALDELRRTEASLRGTVRGLNARLAEVLELHQLGQARLALAEDDRAAAETRNRRLVRELAEAREQLELQIARAHTSELASAREPDERERVERDRRAAQELDAARRALSELEHRVEGMRYGYEARVAELVRELDTLSHESERALVHAGELRSKLDAKERAEASLRGEVSGLRLRLLDREEAIAALAGNAEHAARLEELRQAAAAHEWTASELRHELESLRDSMAAREWAAGELEGEVAALREALSSRDAGSADYETRIAAARDALSARDARIAELEAELANWRGRTDDDRIAELERQLQDALASREQASTEVVALQVAHSALLTELESQLREAHATAARVGELETQLADAQAAAQRLGELEVELRDARSSSERVAELERELQSVNAARDRASGELTTKVGELEERLRDAQSTTARVVDLEGQLREAIASQADLADLRATNEAAERELSGLRITLAAHERVTAELAAARDELAERNRAAARLESELAAVVADRDATLRDAEELRAKVNELAATIASNEAAIVEAAHLRGRLAELEAALREQRETRDAEPASRAQAGVIARVQGQLAQSLDHRRELERQLATQAAELARLREQAASSVVVSKVRAEEEERELAELAARLEVSEEERRNALDALEEARAILQQLAGGFPDRPLASSADPAETRQLRERLARLDAEATDRDLLLRSLTAQLQERDDRLRALERLSSDNGASDPGGLRERLLEMEERVARLTEELEHERDARRRAEDRPQ